MADHFLRVEHLNKVFLETQAVADVSFTIEPAEIVGLVGKNGAGKSTVIKMLAGAVRPDSGTISIDGTPASIDSPHQAQQSGLAFMHQELEQMPQMSVAENLLMGSQMPRRFGLFLDWKKLRTISRRLTELLERDIDPRAMIDDLTVADKRLIMIGRALHAQARLLVLDEPTASLTEREVTHLHDLCRRVRDRGGSIIYVSHRLDEILKLTDRVLVMRDGKLVQESPTADLDTESLVRAIAGDQIASMDSVRARRQKSGSNGEEMPLLQVEKLGRDDAVRDVSFELRPREILGLAGLVGAGRTELARMIFGADRHDTGTIRNQHGPVQLRSPRDGVKARIALLPEDRRHQGLVLDFGVRANLTLAALQRFNKLGIFTSRRQETSVVDDMKGQLDIVYGDAEQPISHLSGGNQQKVVLGKWLVHGADVFIFDEPTAGVDVGAKAQIYQLAVELAERGQGVIFISSEFVELEAICDRVLVMREGQVVGELTGSEVTEDRMVSLCYGIGTPSG